MKIGTGWLGWTERETLDTTMNVIVDAYEARLEMLRWVSNKPQPQKTYAPVAPPRGTPMTPTLIMAMFGKQKS